jgi:branched-chain amino acid transport system permease protein
LCNTAPPQLALGDTFGTLGFIAMMIGGGTEKPIAAMFGGLILGICAEGANAMINSQASDWFPFIILVVVLIVLPRGLFSAGNLFRLRVRAVASARA